MNPNGIGKTIIVGINFFDDNEELLEQYQTSGVIDSVADLKIVIKREDNSLFTLPNDDRAMKDAEPGTYRERATGKEILNPDILAQWAVEGIKDINNIKKYKEMGFDIND